MEDRTARKVATASLLAGFIGTVLGAATGFIGVRQSLQSQENQQRRLFLEERSLDSGARRAEVYAKFQTAANAYAVASIDAYDNARACGTSSCPVDIGVLKPFRDTRFQYQVAINDVYIFGSQDAVQAGRKMSAHLPRSLGIASSDSGLELRLIDSVGFEEVYRGFLSVVCREVPRQPRDNC